MGLFRYVLTIEQSVAVVRPPYRVWYCHVPDSPSHRWNPGQGRETFWCRQLQYSEQCCSADQGKKAQGSKSTKLPGRNWEEAQKRPKADLTPFLITKYFIYLICNPLGAISYAMNSTVYAETGIDGWMYEKLSSFIWFAHGGTEKRCCSCGYCWSLFPKNNVWCFVPTLLITPPMAWW